MSLIPPGISANPSKTISDISISWSAATRPATSPTDPPTPSTPAAVATAPVVLALLAILEACFPPFVNTLLANLPPSLPV